MKKFMLALLLLILVFSSYLITNSTVNRVEIIYQDEYVIVDEKLELIPIGHESQTMETSYALKVDYLYKKDQIFDLYVDIDKELLYFIDSRGKAYTFTEEKKREILSMDVFNTMYANSGGPSVTFMVEDERVRIEPRELNWNYKKLNGDYENVTLSGTHETPRVRLPYDKDIDIYFEDQPHEILVTNELGYAQILDMEPLTVEKTEEDVLYTIKGMWQGEEHFGEVIYEVYLSMDMPVTVTYEEEQIRPGDFVTLEIHNLNPGEQLTFKQDLVNAVEVINLEERNIAILPVSYWTEPGTYHFEVASDTLGLPFVFDIEVEPREFGIQYLTIDEKVAEQTRNEEAYEEFDRYMGPARATSRATPYFEELFIQPVTGRISTEYGIYRYVNGSLTSYRHSGIDIATDKGTPILASNTGRVTLSRPLILTGNTLVIDHGLGIFSVYYHLDQLMAGEGDKILRGEMIGTVGSTGFSTGPHLHWMITHYTTNLDPFEFLEKPVY
ncbi:MAG: hypothetical protein AVO33_09635 [delta proteobacterium ML8_F1]|nr:MAG: hypothetical protein AVO33_09635 [delta proteobacterium ML8_F1]